MSCLLIQIYRLFSSFGRDMLLLLLGEIIIVDALQNIFFFFFKSSSAKVLPIKLMIFFLFFFSAFIYFVSGKIQNQFYVSIYEFELIKWGKKKSVEIRLAVEFYYLQKSNHMFSAGIFLKICLRYKCNAAF